MTIMSQHEVPATSHDHSQTKRHAQLAFAPRATPFWVGNTADWEIVRRRPRPPLVCPEPGCDLELTSYENLHNRKNPRIFKFKNGTKPCGHWTAADQGGGPESLQHQWLKNHLVETATRYGYTATPEHYPTHADVYVEDPAYCLEVQLVSTNFTQRTRARRSQGAQVCWFIRDGLNSDKARAAVFQGPSVRFRVVEAADRGRPAAPWDEPEGEAGPVQVQVFATIAHAPRASEPPTAKPGGLKWFATHPMDVEVFLDQILSGRRQWHRPGTVHPKRGYWILEKDLARFREYQQQLKQELRQIAAQVPAQDSNPLPASPPSTTEASAPSSQNAALLEISPDPEHPSRSVVSDRSSIAPEREPVPQDVRDRTGGPTRRRRAWLAWLKWFS